jgi:hypothetical protein
VGEAAVVSKLGKKTPNGWNRIAEPGSHGLYPPAWLLEEKSGEAFAWLWIDWHNGLLIKYCIPPNIVAKYAILYQKAKAQASERRYRSLALYSTCYA